MRATWDVGVQRRRGVGHSKEQTRVLVEEASLEPAKFGKMIEIISPHEKGQYEEVAIERKYMNLWSEPVRG